MIYDLILSKLVLLLAFKSHLIRNWFRYWRSNRFRYRRSNRIIRNWFRYWRSNRFRYWRSNRIIRNHAIPLDSNFHFTY